MKAQVESISPVKTKLTIQVPPEDLARETDRAFQDLRRTVTVPGFRKGKVPLPVLKRMYGERVQSDVVGRVIEKSYYDALRQEEIVPVSDADIQLQDASEQAGVSYTAVVEVRPKVEPRSYHGMTLQKDRVAVEEPDVDARLESLRSQRATFEPADADREAAHGDMVTMDYAGAIDGEPFDGGKGEDRTLILGSGSLIPGFEEGLVGAKAGETRELDLRFPDDYRAEDLAGKEARFTVTVKDVKVRRLPEVDEEFAKEVAGVETPEAMRARIREVIEAEKRSNVERAFRDHVIDALLAANPFEVPDSLVRNQQSYSLDRLRTDLSQRGLDPQALGIDRPEVQEVHRRGAERSVRWAFLLRAIADAEGLTVTDDEVDARIRAIAEADGRPYATVRAFFDEEDRLDSLRSHLLDTKVIEHVVASATVEEVDAVQAEDREEEDNA